MEPETVHIAKELVRKLLTRRPAMHIIMYHSPQYDSVYLKFDLGVANSCRIADHESNKDHLAYRFNILLDAKSVSRDDSGKYPKFTYLVTEMDMLADVIVANAQAKLDTWGEEKYQHFMDKNEVTLPDNKWYRMYLNRNWELEQIEFGG